MTKPRTLHGHAHGLLSCVVTVSGSFSLTCRYVRVAVRDRARVSRTGAFECQNRFGQILILGPQVPSTLQFFLYLGFGDSLTMDIF